MDAPPRKKSKISEDQGQALIDPRAERADGVSEGLRPAIAYDDTGSNSAVRGQQRPIDVSIFRTEWPKRLYGIMCIVVKDIREVPDYGA